MEKMMLQYRLYGYIVLVAAVLAVAVLLFKWLGEGHVGSFDTIDDAGMYGDSFGYVNALFSALAFAGIVLALIIQTFEYSLAATERREGLEIQRKISRQQFFSTLATAIDALGKVHTTDIQYLGSVGHLQSELFAREQHNALRAIVNSMITDSSQFTTSDHEELLQAKNRTGLVGELIDFHKAFFNTVRGLYFSKDRSPSAPGRSPEEFIKELVELYQRVWGVNSAHYISMDWNAGIEALSFAYGEFMEAVIEATSGGGAAELTKELIEETENELESQLYGTASAYLQGGDVGLPNIR